MEHLRQGGGVLRAKVFLRGRGGGSSVGHGRSVLLAERRLHQRECQDPRPHAWSMFFFMHFPVTGNPSRAATFPNIDLFHQVTYP